MVDIPPNVVHKLKEAEIKNIVKLAIKEWLDEQISMFGRWSLRTLFATGLAAAVYFMLIANGWTHK